MSTFNFAPLYRSTIGFDRLFDLLDNSVRPDWPPYNIEKKGENEYRVSMAVAGFRPEEIEMTQQGGSLVVSGQRKLEENSPHLLHQGIASRSFRQTFNIADDVRVVGANLENGLLSVDLVREVPEAMKPKRIEINAGRSVDQDNRPKQLGHGSEGRKAA